jgi:hypothetical protein
MMIGRTLRRLEFRLVCNPVSLEIAREPVMGKSDFEGLREGAEGTEIECLRNMKILQLTALHRPEAG